MNALRGTLLDYASGTATVLIDGSLSGALECPVNLGLDDAELTPGRRVAVLFFDEAQQDAVLIAVWE